MKVLVTGGAGYLGTSMLPLLLEKGHEVRILDKLMWGVTPILSYFSHPRVEFMSGDIRDQQVITDALSGMDAVIHLAGIVGYPACTADVGLAESTNVDGTALLVDSLQSHQKLVFASTGSTYGVVDGVCDESTPINPLTVYGKNKQDGENLVDKVGGVKLRLATVFGVSPRLRLDLLVNDFCYQAIHNGFIIMFEGYHRRTFLHVRDAAKAFVFTLDHFDEMAGDVFNVGDENLNFNKKDIALKIQKLNPFYLHEADVGKDMDQRNYEVNYDKIKNLGFTADISLEQGIEELLKVCRFIKIENPWRNH
ncbi:MAG: NAD(P)-dependent oxidoreductase [Candidatus Nitrohelix vancouverensis]|uniref:NAD(P)-dependent oxidoreductase n=1 Tax=Candidatus Nitrohelix vancouverensis TaxID=2705534 RepID=A0A7T0G3F4_9BACT|nr:MAG: NAD(P)-dependent oxidoreductase [Candidatus Nitrohelix vancouverensis]